MTVVTALSEILFNGTFGELRLATAQKGVKLVTNKGLKKIRTKKPTGWTIIRIMNKSCVRDCRTLGRKLIVRSPDFSEYYTANSMISKRAVR